MLLKAQLAILPSKARSEYTFSKRKKVEGIEYPYPNVTLHEAQKDDPEAALRVEWTLVKQDISVSTSGYVSFRTRG